MTTFFRRLRAARQTPPTVEGAGRLAKSASIEAEIIRVDGTRIPIGVVSAYHRNVLVHAWRQWRADRRMARFYRTHPQYKPQEQQA